MGVTMTETHEHVHFRQEALVLMMNVLAHRCDVFEVSLAHPRHCREPLQQMVEVVWKLCSIEMKRRDAEARVMASEKFAFAGYAPRNLHVLASDDHWQMMQCSR